MTAQEDLDLAKGALAAADPHLALAETALVSARIALDEQPEAAGGYAQVAIAETLQALAAAGRSLLDAFITEATADLVAGGK